MTNPTKIVSEQAAEMLQAYRDRRATGAAKYKQIFQGYMQAAQEFTERTGQPAPQVVFAVGSDVFKVTGDDDNGFNLNPINEKNRTREGYDFSL